MRRRTSGDRYCPGRRSFFVCSLSPVPLYDALVEWGEGAIDVPGANLTATEHLERARAEAEVTQPAVSQRVAMRLELPWKTIAKVIATLAMIWLLSRLWTILLLVFIAVMLAAAINPVVRRLQRVGLPRTAAVALVFIVVLGVSAGILLLLIPPLFDEGRQLAADLPSYVERAEGLLKDNPDIYRRIQDAANEGSADPSVFFSGFLAFGSGLITAISNGLIVLVLTIYILVDGERIFSWCVRYLPDKQERKLSRAIPEVSKVVSGYVVGQLITSALFGTFTFIVLTLLDVPQPLFLAIIAAFFDAIPIAGVFIATVPAVLLAATVSWEAAAITLVAYVIYQQIENYLIVPRVYQKSLNVSSFAVLIAILIGGELLGIIGVLLALPIAAVVPAIEKIWIEEEGGPIGTDQWREEMAKADAEAEEVVGDGTAGPG